MDEVRSTHERLREQLEAIQSRVGELTQPATIGDSASRSQELEGMKIAASFQRELFRINDGRLANTDAQAAILIAAAVAIATFTGGLVRTGEIHGLGLVGTGASAVLVTVLALYARRERPRFLGLSTAMKRTGDQAGDKVAKMYDLVQNGSLDDLKTARAEFDAWYALSASIKARREVKSTWYVSAVVVLLLELGVAIYTALSLNPTVNQ
jgi:hypothetical protein